MTGTSQTAETPRAAARADGRRTYILFTVSGTTYGVASDLVLHMEMVEAITPVPNAPPFVEGVVFSRGHVVPVVNLRVRFGFERAPVSAANRLLVVQADDRRIALLADDAREFIGIDDAAVQPPHDAVKGLNGHYIEGVTTIGDRIVLILHVQDVVAIGPAPTSA